MPAKPPSAKRRQSSAPVPLSPGMVLGAVGVAALLTLLGGLLMTPARPRERVSTVRFDRREVIVVDDFFPADLVAAWKHKLRAEWERGNWYYATNNDGSDNYANMNKKTVSKERIEARRRVAARMYEQGAFSYSKWELQRSNPVHLEIKAFMESPETIRRVERILGVQLKWKMGDFFTSLFRKGDFLSAHSDVYGGTWAAVAYMSEGTSDGGSLSFYCER